MAELTREQMMKAYSAWLKVCGQPQEPLNRNPLAEECFRAMAPHLQLPWELPTREETDSIREFNSLAFTCEFVRRRNAALQPKPVDPRIDTIDRTLCGFMHHLNNTEDRIKAAKEILAALDEVK